MRVKPKTLSTGQQSAFRGQPGAESEFESVISQFVNQLRPVFTVSVLTDGGVLRICFSLGSLHRSDQDDFSMEDIA